MNQKIILTGGGTAGHVTPNIALIDALKHDSWQIYYIGSEDGIEKTMLADINIPFVGVKSGKLRRYFSWKNFLDPFKIVFGIVQSFFHIHKLKPDVVFSKGGFVAFPVVVGAWLNRVPVVAHESDMTPGLANRLSYPFAKRICLTFEPAQKHFKNPEKTEVTGTPIRESLFHGDKEKGLKLCGFTSTKPCILVIGGSQGAKVINQCVRESLGELLKNYQVIHICGKGNVQSSLGNQEGYRQFEYVNDDLADLFAASDMVISRSGANSLCEILALKKPHLLIPLSRKASRGDQIHNATYFQKQGISMVIEEESLTPEKMLTAVEEIKRTQFERVEKMASLNIQSSSDKILTILYVEAKRNRQKECM